MSLVVLSVLAAFLVSQNATPPNLPVQDQASLGIALAREGKFPEAEQQLQEAVRSAPGNALYRAQLGSILGLEGKWKEALESFQKAVDLAPDKLDFRRETAAVQWQLGLLSAAEENLRYVLAKNSRDPGAILLLGLVKERSGDYVTATQLLGSQFEAVISQPDRTVALFHSIVESGQRDKLAEVVDVLKTHANDKRWSNATSQSLQIAILGDDLETSKLLFALIPIDDPERPVAGFQLAKLFYTHAQMREAGELLLQLVEQGMESAPIQSLLGSCFESEHQSVPALRAYQRAIDLEPSQIEYYEAPILLLVNLGSTNDALTLVKHAFTIAPNDARVWMWKGNVELRMHAYDDAIESYKHSAKLDSSKADAILGVAATYFISGQNSAASSEYKTAMLRFPNDARLYVAYAEMLLASPDSLRRQPEEQSLLEKAVKLAPQLAEAHYQLGQLALQQKRFKDAEAEFLLAQRSNPEASKLHFALATVYRRMGRADEARTEFARYQELKTAEEGGIAPTGMATGNP